MRTTIDLLAFSGALWLAFLVRFDWSLPPQYFTQLLLAWPWVLALRYLSLLAFGVTRFTWRYIGLRDLPRIAFATASATVVLFAIRGGLDGVGGDVGLHHLQLPIGVILAEAVLAFSGTIGVRAIRRLMIERRGNRGQGAEPSEAEATIVIGAGRAGHMLVRELRNRRNLAIRPVAFVDDDPTKTGRLVEGIPVVGETSALAAIARRYDAGLALIAIASANSAAVRRITELCEAASLKVKIIPPLHEIASGRVGISQVRDVAIEDLLGRAPVVLDNKVAEDALRGKVVLITGAGGSIGSELCRQTLLMQPSALILVDHSENNLYHIHRELVALDGETPIVPAVANVCDGERMEELFDMYRPHAVFHAAAHKHVPLMEDNPGEAIKNNVFGTKQVADLAHEYGVERFVLISTDKAVNPSSVMGATKRLAELYVQHVQRRSSSRFVAVRFGNVLGSAGSVIPLFREQIRKGGPVTLTHPDMTRFFMTIPEASRLVIEAAGISQGGEVMVLDMGEPVPILDLANRLIRLSGFEPGRDIEISYVGMRPGEKLHEELGLRSEAMQKTPCRKILVWRGSQTRPRSIEEALAFLSDVEGSPAQVRERLRQVLPEYDSRSWPAIHREKKARGKASA